MKTIPDGVWPTMPTAYTQSGEIDYNAMEHMVEWFIKAGVSGLFAVCQSSEMALLSLKERCNLARFVVEKSAGRIPVVASGHISETIDDQIDELKAAEESGAQAVVIVTNKLARCDEGDGVWMKNAETILNAMPGVMFGLYECPAPYKRLMTPELLKFCASTGRFTFLKDTCCDLTQIKEKLDAVSGTPLKLFNANAATLLASLKMGAAGFSGVMANFFPDLISILCSTFKTQPARAEILQNFLGAASLAEAQVYPANAKYTMKLNGLPINISCRNMSHLRLTPALLMEIEQLHRLTGFVREAVLTEGANA